MTEKQVVEALAAGKITADEALKLLAEGKEKPLTVKVSPDGKKVAIYGAQKFPITHWPRQWRRILDGVTAAPETIVGQILARCAEVEAAAGVQEALAEAAENAGENAEGDKAEEKAA